MKNFINVMSFLLMTSTVFGQVDQFKDLRIGDTLPHVIVRILSNNALKEVPLRKLYEHQPIILDFWATWCSPCLIAIADGDSLSKVMQRKFKIVPVTRESDKIINQFLASKSMLRGRQIDYIISDTLLSTRLFKFSTIPHQVWIDNLGVVKAITYPDEVIKENLEKFINKQQLRLTEKKDNTDFDFTKPLIVKEDNMLYRSVLIPYQDGMVNMIGAFYPIMAREQKINRFLAINNSILNMFFYSFSHGLANHTQLNRIELNVSDSVSLSAEFSKISLSRMERNATTYCYELYLPEKVIADRFFSGLLTELNKLFKYTAVIEKRLSRCWILNSQRNHTGFELKENNGSFEAKWQNGVLKKAKNINAQMLATYLNWNMDTMAVVNETKMTSSFDIELAAEIDEQTGFMNVKRIQESLNSCGMSLTPGYRYVDMLVIRQK